MAHPYGAPAGYASPAQRPRRRRWPWVLLAVVVVLAALLVAADRVALAIAEDKAASTLQSSQHLSKKPDVSVSGFPFLTQLAAGEFDNVSITANGIDVGDGPTLNLATVDVHLHHVTVPRDYSSVRARTATADARATYAALSRTLGFTVADGGGGRLVAKPSVTVAGQKFSGTVSAVVHASSAHGLSFGDPKVTAAGVSLPRPVVTALAAIFDKSISLSGLPFNVRVDGVEVRSDGVVLHLSGRDLVYSGS